MKVDLIYINKCRRSGKSWTGMLCWFRVQDRGEYGHDEDLTGDVTGCREYKNKNKVITTAEEA